MRSTMQERWNAVMMPNYGTPPIALDHGRGVRVWDTDGREYLDFVAGIAVSSLGHAHPAIVEAVIGAGRAAGAHVEPGHARARHRARRAACRAARTSGTGVLRQQRRRGERVRAQARPARTVAAAAAAGSSHATTASTAALSARCRSPATPPNASRSRRCPVRSTSSSTATSTPCELPSARTPRHVFVEPTLGEGGVVAPPAGFLAAARADLRRNRRPAVVDEVQSGIGRTGHWFASQAEGVRPDVITLAKGLGGGLPIGACIGIGAAGELFAPGDHGSTFGGNPVVLRRRTGRARPPSPTTTCSTTSSGSAITSPGDSTRLDTPFVSDAPRQRAVARGRARATGGRRGRGCGPRARAAGERGQARRRAAGAAAHPDRSRGRRSGPAVRVRARRCCRRTGR